MNPDPDPAGSSRSPASTPGPGGVPLVGRRAELAEIRAAMAGRGVLIAGPAGVGKSRLAREVAGQLSRQGRRLLPVRASGSAARLPLAALAGVLPTGTDPAANPVQQAVAGLRGLAPATLVIDDAHRLDDASAAAVHEVVAAGTLPLLATVRSGEPVPEAVTALWKDAGVHRLDLRPLPDPDMEALVELTLGGPVEGRGLRRLRDAAAGNPLFLRELVASVREAGRLDRAGGVWRLTGPLPVAPRLTELLRDRIATSDPAERDALELLAIEQPVPLRLAAELIGEPVLETLERRGLVTVTRSGRRRLVRLHHPLYAELVRADTPEVAAARHRRRLADALIRYGARRGEDVTRVALSRLEDGGEVDPALMLAAAEQALLVREYPLAERLARRAYEDGGGVPAGLLAVRAAFQLGQWEPALRLCRELARVARTDEERTWVAVQHASVLVHGADDVEAGRAVLAGASVEDPWCRRQLDAHQLYLRACQLDCAVAEPALASLQAADTPETRVAAAAAAGSALLLAGRLVDSEQLLSQILPLPPYTGPSQVQWAGFPAAVALRHCDIPDLAAAEASATDTYQASLRPPDRVAQALAAFALAKLALLRGRPVTARRWADEAWLVADDLHMRGLRRWATGLRLQAGAQIGGSDLAGLAAGLAAEVAGRPGARLFDIEVSRGPGWSPTRCWPTPTG